MSQVFRDLALRFDGENERDVTGRLKSLYATEQNSSAANFLFGLLSQEEAALVAQGLTDRIGDYFEDVDDTASGPRLRLRSGAVQQISSGSLIVNCTGTFLRNAQMAPFVPCVSEQGRVLCVTIRDGLFFLTSFSGFFLPHLHYRGLLRDGPFYVMDQEALYQKHREAWVAAAFAQAYLNQSLLVQTLPMRVLNRCHLDFDRWYPLPRRAWAASQMLRRAQQDQPRLKRALDRVAERFELNCGPLTSRRSAAVI